MSVKTVMCENWIFKKIYFFKSFEKNQMFIYLMKMHNLQLRLKILIYEVLWPNLVLAL